MRSEDSGRGGSPVVVDEGQALETLEPRPRNRFRLETEVDVLVIGAGQAGLSVGYHLLTQGIRNFVLLDGNARIGDSWRQRWDSLRLFSAARFDGLDGMPFPAPPGTSRPRTRWPTTSRPTRGTSSSRCGMASGSKACPGREGVTWRPRVLNATSPGRW
jgi:hypothetical protein